MWIFSCAWCVCMQVEAIDFKLSVQPNLNDIKLNAPAWVMRVAAVPKHLKRIANDMRAKQNECLQDYQRRIEAARQEIGLIATDVESTLQGETRYHNHDHGDGRDAKM